MNKKIGKVLTSAQLKATYACAMITTGAFLTPLGVFASDYNWISKKPGKNDAFSALKDQTQSLGKSGFQFARTVGVIALVVALIMAGISLATGKSAQKREEAKSQIVNILAAGALIFGAVGIVGIVYSFGTSIK